MLTDDDLRDVDRRLLDYLADGRVTPVYARKRLEEADVGEYSRGYVQQRLGRLEEHDHATNRLGVGLYELVNDPRTDTDQPTTDIAGLREELRDVRAERDDLQDTVDDLHSELENTHSSVDTHRLETLLGQIETAAERGDGDALRSAVKEAREVLDDGE